MGLLDVGTYGAFILCLLTAICAPPSYAFGVLAAFTFSPFFRLSVGLGATPLGLRPEDLMMAILAVRSALRRSRPKGGSTVRRFVILYLALASVISLSFLFTLAANPIAIVNLYGLQKLVGVTAVLYIGYMNVRSLEDYRVFLVTTTIGALCLCSAVLLTRAEVVTTVTTTSYDSAMYAVKANNIKYLTEWNPNSIGIAAGCVFLLLAPFTFESKKLRHCILSIVVTVPLGLALLNSYSRTALSGVLIGTVYIAAKSIKSRRALIGLALVPALVGFGALAGFRQEALQMSFGENRNVGDRVRYWKAAVTAIAEKPFGYGAGVEDYHLGPLVQEPRASAHNDWFDFALAIGVGGALLAIWTFGTLYSYIRKGITPRRTSHAVVLGVNSCLIFFFVSSLAGQVFVFQKVPFVVLSAFLGLAASCYDRKRWLGNGEGRATPAWGLKEVVGQCRDYARS